MTKLFGERWKVKDSLGEGGQGRVYFVTDANSSDSTQYVLKRLKNKERISRFHDEVEAVRKLNHRNIIEILDFDLTGDEPYLVTKFYSGLSLDKADPYWKDSPEIALSVFHAIVCAISYAHNRGIIHRDIKPANIFLREPGGEPVVGDFGICYIEDDGERFTLTDEAVGPWRFMAPELEDGRLDELSPKCDVYSLGKLLYWLVSGGRVFNREKHRDPKYDVRGLNPDTVWNMGWNNIYLEHVNRLLDLMIVDDPARRRDAGNIEILTRNTIRLLRGRYTPLGKGLPQPCTYCGHGKYVEQERGIDAANMIGLIPVSPNDWRVLVCNACGHVQFFLANKAANKEWWRS